MPGWLDKVFNGGNQTGVLTSKVNSPFGDSQHIGEAIGHFFGMNKGQNNGLFNAGGTGTKLNNSQSANNLFNINNGATPGWKDQNNQYWGQDVNQDNSLFTGQEGDNSWTGDDGETYHGGGYDWNGDGGDSGGTFDSTSSGNSEADDSAVSDF